MFDFLRTFSPKTEKNEANIIPHFPCDSYRLNFVCLSHLGIYNFMTSLVQSAIGSRISRKTTFERVELPG